MSREQGGRRGRRFVLAGLFLALVPMAPNSREQPCDTKGTVVSSLICTPIGLLQTLGPYLRVLITR